MSIASSNRVALLFGPTASGKTSLIEELFLESRVRRGLPEIELVSADSMQVYRGMDIGTAKPDARQRKLLPHHLIDIRSPSEQFDAGDFVRLADEACQSACARNRLPLLSGGTAFYLKNFLYGLPQTPKADAATRSSVAAEMLDAGVEEMHRRLGLVDGESAARIAVTDTYRVARALEVYRSSGKKLSSFTVPASVRARWNFICVSVVRPRDELYRRIDARVDAMFDAGLIDEIRFLVRSGYNAEDPGMKAIGYREFFDHGDPLSILDSLPMLERVREAIKLDSRHYAKRQILFMKSLPGVMECPADDRDHLASLIKSFIMTH